MNFFVASITERELLENKDAVKIGGPAELFLYITSGMRDKNIVDILKIYNNLLERCGDIYIQNTSNGPRLLVVEHEHAGVQ